MNNFIFSPSENAFYPVALKYSYEASKTWPDDGISVNDAIFSEFTSIPPDGKYRSVGEGGMPVWVELPPPTHEDLNEIAEQQREALIGQADETTADWRVMLMLGEISDADKAKLLAWMDYKKALKAVDISTAPDVIWPIPPAQ